MSRRTRERRQREEAEAKSKKGFMNLWEFRALRFIFKLIIYLVFFSCIGLTGSLTWNWFTTKFVRMQPIEQAVEVAQKNLYAVPPNPDAVRSWLARRPFSEADELIKLMDPFVGRMSGMTFIIYAGWLANEGKIDDAVFWRQYARFRIRYDAVRCGSYDAVGLINDILNDVPQPAVKQRLTEAPEILPDILLKVLQYDKEHPAANDPKEFCDGLTKGEEFKTNTKIAMTKPQEWPGIYGSLRGVTKAEIYGMILEARKNGHELNPDHVDTPKPEDKDKTKPCPAAAKGKKARPCAAKNPDQKEPAPKESVGP